MMRLPASVFLFACLGVPLCGQQPSATELQIFQKAAQIDVENATIDGVIRLLGEPQEYLWGNNKFLKDNLPPRYIAGYPGRFHVVVNAGAVLELRFYQPGYRFMNAIEVGSSLDDVLKVLGPPASVVEGQRNAFADGVLYKDVDGARGHHYYSTSKHGVRMFFAGDRIIALYVTRRSQLRQATGQKPASAASNAALSLDKYEDVRRLPRSAAPAEDISKLDLSGAADIIPTLTFNQQTVWPEPSRMPPGVRPEDLMKDGMNAGLGVRALHAKGITGKGIAVAIIDQPLYLDHPEFAGKIVEYHDTGCGDSETSMHGPAVASLLVGTQTGVAPDARVYFAAVPSWLGDASYYAKALDWILAENGKLPASRKIRVVSVSAAPSGEGSAFKKNTQMWDDALARAEQAGVLVLDCTRHHGLIGPCWFSGGDRENPARCTPGFPGTQVRPLPNRVLAPASSRTVAEEYRKGEFGYQYTGRGGLSWAIPYAAGVLALGWQQRPELSGRQMTRLLFESAYGGDADTKIIHPAEFICAVVAYSGK